MVHLMTLKTIKAVFGFLNLTGLFLWLLPTCGVLVNVTWSS